MYSLAPYIVPTPIVLKRRDGEFERVKVRLENFSVPTFKCNSASILVRASSGPAALNRAYLMRKMTLSYVMDYIFNQKLDEWN